MAIKTTNFIRNIIEQDLRQQPQQEIKLRFPPEPNGLLHIGHIKAICLNFGLADLYNGTCNLRFDDTNPITESAKYIDAIKDNIRWLNFNWDKLCYASDYFDYFFDYALELINKNLAFVCFLDTNKIREYRGTLVTPGKNSPYRNASVAENIKHFMKMKDGKYKEGECVLRLKIDMTSPVMALRDPTIYRILHKKHHKTYDKWCIYPLYDFAHPISDAIEGITHSLCTLEFQDNRLLYDWILKNIYDFNNDKRPRQYEFSRLNLSHTLTSKRKINQLIKNNKVSGIDDPRLPTIAGLKRRGYTAKALKLFIDRVGVSKIDALTDFKILEDCLRYDLNINALRAMAVIDPLEVDITNYDDKVMLLSAPKQPQKDSLGSRDIYFGKHIYIDRNDFMEHSPNNKYKRLSINKEVRLRNSFIIKATAFDTNESGEITKVYATYDKNTLNKNPQDGRKVKGVIHFVEKTTAIKAKFMLYDKLFNNKNPSEQDEINKNSLVIKNGFVEKNMINAKPQQVYQFERLGYFCRDSSDNMIFNKTVNLRSSFT